jgi:hypothetical protein
MPYSLFFSLQSFVIFLSSYTKDSVFSMLSCTPPSRFIFSAQQIITFLTFWREGGKGFVMISDLVAPRASA